MPIIEVDMLIALVNALDKFHQVAANFFNKIAAGKIKHIKVSSAAYLEYELILKSRSYLDSEIQKDLTAFRSFPNLGEAPLTLNVILTASKIREKYKLSYFDSLHAATAILIDNEIISSDEDYQRVKGLKTIVPQKLV
ncbi:type II toxin-antitoxin system VapC family toxin [Candidatus Bathyarchaeota archaeon]|nr:type II toxin-antitoxin system VapC family toxin [Candidatus Bathyarchaeota archaeon]